MTTKITGKNAVITWTSTEGTVTLNTDYRSITQSPGVDLADCTAGADAYKKYIATIKDATIEYAGLLGTGGSATLDALEPGVEGTLLVQPEGTASGAPSTSYPAICMGAQVSTPYADVVEIAVTFQANGEWS